MFVPMNFHDRDPSRKRAQGAKLMTSDDSERTHVKYYGARYEGNVKVPLVSSVSFLEGTRSDRKI
jgi:hypothetical protein